MSKTIYFGEFHFRYKYQYYRKTNGRLLPSGSPYGSFSGVSEKIFLEGEEDKVWDDILKELGDSETKRFTITNKRIENLVDTGKTVSGSL